MAAHSFATASISQRIAMIEDALARVLNRSGSMSVEMGQTASERALYVTEGPWDGAGRERHDLYEMARELEVLLA